MNVDYNTLITAAYDVVNSHTWGTFWTTKPTIYKGPRQSVDAAGAIVVIAHGSQTAEGGTNPGNTTPHEKVLWVLGGVPWADTDQNETDRSNLASEIERIFVANRQLGGIIQLKFKQVLWSRDTLLGPSTQQYRCVTFQFAAHDRR